MAIVAASALIGAAFMGSTLVTPLYPLYEQRFGFSKITLTLVYATYVVGNLVALVFFGRLSDQLGRRKVAIPAIALAMCSALLFWFASSTAWLYEARGLSGFAVGIASGTGTAWLAELYGASQRRRATVMATVANMIGIAIGPLIGGLLAQYSSRPLVLPFVAYVALLAATALAILLWPPETVSRAVALRDVDLRPRVGVPPEIRARFVAPAVTAFACFALTGFYYALIPSLLRETLGIGNLAVAGAVVFELVATVIVVLLLARRLPSQSGMFAGLFALFPSLGVLVAAQLFKSMPLLLIASAFAGASLALGYRGGLQVVNDIAPPDRRAEVVSSYFVTCFVGNSVPVVGVGILSTVYDATTALVALSCVLALMAVAALLVGNATSRRAYAHRS